MLRMIVIFPRKTQKARTGGAVSNFIRKLQDFNLLFSCVSCFSWTIKAICVTSVRNVYKACAGLFDVGADLSALCE
jgi:hypothetical protein